MGHESLQTFEPHLCDRNQRRSYVLAEYRKGISEDILGYHGLGIETLDFAIENGFLPGKTIIWPQEADYLGSKLGDFYFFPLGKTLSHDEAYSGAADYAYFISKRQALISMLGLDYNDPEVRDAAMELVDQNSLDQYKKAAQLQLQTHNKSAMDIELGLQESLKRKGCVIGISPKAISFFEHLAGDDEGDVFLRCGEMGLPLEFIHGVVPLGSFEEIYLGSFSDTD